MKNILGTLGTFFSIVIIQENYILRMSIRLRVTKTIKKKTMVCFENDETS